MISDVQTPHRGFEPSNCTGFGIRASWTLTTFSFELEPTRCYPNRVDKLNTPTANYVIADNIIETDQHQIAAIRVDTRTETHNIQITDNLMIGENPKILIEGPDQDAVTSERNRGARVQRVADQN
jgi:hypothetical protein